MVNLSALLRRSIEQIPDIPGLTAETDQTETVVIGHPDCRGNLRQTRAPEHARTEPVCRQINRAQLGHHVARMRATHPE